MTEKKTWLEVALNGPWGHAARPGIPRLVEDIVAQGIACAKAGAAIIHVHAYDETSGRQHDDADLYHRIIAGIREKVDVIVYPTVPLAGMAGQADAGTPQQCFAHVEELGKRGVLEWAAVDPGSVNFSHYDDLVADRVGFVYVNPEEQVRYGLKLAMRYHFHPAFAVYEPGFMRLGATLHWRESSPAPVYRFMFSRGYTFGFPPEDYGVTAYLNLLDQVAPGANWMIGGLDVDVLPLVPRAVMEGGHVRVGMEDAPANSTKSNLQWVEEAVQAIENSGGQLANAEEVRQAISPEDFPEQQHGTETLA
jgi:3-keto-5-aminohexanoate cleavage enzyme